MAQDISPRREFKQTKNVNDCNRMQHGVNQQPQREFVWRLQQGANQEPQGANKIPSYEELELKPLQGAKQERQGEILRRPQKAANLEPPSKDIELKPQQL